MVWRLLDVGIVDGPTGTSIFEAVGIKCSRGVSPNTIIFWRVNPPCVYLGYHQLVEKEVNLENCEKLGIKVVRRILGGGCVYCDKNQLLYSIIVNTRRSNIPCRMENAYKKILGGVVLALKKLGLEEVYYEEKLNAVVANGKKISGNAGLLDSNLIIVNGSFLLDFDYKSMSKLLLNPTKNLPGNPKKPEDGLTHLKRELNREVNFQEVKKALKEGFEEALNIKLRKGSLTNSELYLASKLKPKYLSREWIFLMDLKHKNMVKKKA